MNKSMLNAVQMMFLAFDLLILLFRSFRRIKKVGNFKGVLKFREKNFT